MDLENTGRPLAELADPLTVFFTVLLLALAPFLLGVATMLLLRAPAGNWKAVLAGRLGSKPPLSWIPRGMGVAGCVVLLPFVIVADWSRLEELLALPYGMLLVLIACALGVLVAMTVTQRPWSKRLLMATGALAVVAIVGSILFAGQFHQYAPAHEGDATPGASAAPAPGDEEPTTEPTAEPTPTPADPGVVSLPQGEYATTEICLDDHGSEPVAVTVSGPWIIEAELSDGTVVQVGDAFELRPCSEPEGTELLRYAPGKAFEQFDGTPYPIEGQSAVALIATLTSPDGEQLAWVWHVKDGVTASGLIPVGDVQS